MIRKPLRPLAQILPARQRGESPEEIEAEHRRARIEAQRDRQRQRAEGRLFLLGLFFFAAFSTVGLRMGLLAASEPTEPRVAAVSGTPILAQRADITDRNGRILATNLSTYALYAHPQEMVEPERAAAELAAIFPHLEEEKLRKLFLGDRKFVWVERTLSPAQRQAVFDIGEPGLLFGPRETRLYPNGKLAAHVLGGAGFGREGVASAEVVGRAGVEKAYDAYLRDPAKAGAPLTLSLDMTIQAATRDVLEAGKTLLNAKGATAILMDIYTGELISLVSLPDFDPNDRPRPLTTGDQGDSPLFNRAVQGVYELGSVFKIFTAAQAIDIGLVNADSVIDTSGPMKIGRFSIKEFRNKDYGAISVSKIIEKSSNRGTGRLALQIGAKRQREFLDKLGFFDPTELEMVEAATGRPLVPQRWGELTTVTVSYGHGLSSSPIHVAAGYATMLNGGTRVRPTLLRQPGPQNGERVIKETTSEAARRMLRAVVGGEDGTASFADVEGYSVGGKTGTADKPKANGGGYYDDRVIATFAGGFPTNDPKYVIVVTFDEPVETSGKKPRRTAGWTAVPVAGEIIRRTAPLLGMAPQVGRADLPQVIPTGN